MPIIYLTTTGAKSGLPHSTRYCAFRDGENLILLVPTGATLKNPSWAYNLRANPQRRFVKGKRSKISARVNWAATSGVYWQKAVRFYPPYVSYEQRSNRFASYFLLES